MEELDLTCCSASRFLIACDEQRNGGGVVEGGQHSGKVITNIFFTAFDVLLVVTEMFEASKLKRLLNKGIRLFYFKTNRV